MKTIKILIKFFLFLAVLLLFIYTPLGNVFGSPWFFGFLGILILGLWGFVYLMYKEDRVRKSFPKEGKKEL